MNKMRCKMDERQSHRNKTTKITKRKQEYIQDVKL